jgi:alpha-D-xyloside xylohydrolase
VMRSMVLEFPDDPACRYLDRQYMLGSSLLVAPVFRRDNLAEYYLPNGRWTHLLTNESIIGGQWRRETIDFMSLPLFAREGSLIPMSNCEEQPQWRLDEPLSLHVFLASGDMDVTLRLTPSDSATAARIKCRKRGNHITLEGDGRATALSVVLRNIREVKDLANSKISGEPSHGLVVEWIDVKRTMTVTLPDYKIVDSSI